ncbi:Xaa-Pro peptidase family protein [Rhodoplanes sp. TEM]|uniref:Xaa-Pro peptidase family protein n=1 Tax=Rhodoplanes tepidamans TaxID=200616 RepID=A0ABT5J3Z6_RHOTP|nr:MULTISPECIES: Xaa-Pro peptidase family protein [Rhodoplanes]MDC7784380.1 Xaa-Pro peptidase family protein [Rhodoplanes tepidamans]MDC7988020.1 Xaa-Pro peptidase family protein [Rhodoplanes sp. TEM]MDQ0354491.1 Xaa-Pro aminopeptidase [Rhodoplanes tepidamans]
MHYRDDMRAIAEAARAKAFAAARDDATVIVSTDPIHVGWLTGYRSVLADADRYFRCAAILTPERTVLVTGTSDAAPALEVLRDPTCIHRYGVFYVSSVAGGIDLASMPEAKATFPEALAAAVAAHVRPGDVVGIDAAAPADLQQVEALAGCATTFDVRPAVIRARSVKTPGEIATMRHAAAITERGLAKALDAARPGMTELDLATIISTEIVAGGGIPRFVVVTAGDRAALADAYATRAVLAPGDLVRFDLGCTVDGYWCDMARTAVVGAPTALQRDRYQALLDGELAQLAIAKAGVTAGELFEVAVNRVRQGALPDYRRSHCGHGLGIGPHEFPTLNPANRDVEILENMVLCVETPFYELGWGGMMVEDIILIKPDGCECLTELPRDLRVLG